MEAVVSQIHAQFEDLISVINNPHLSQYPFSVDHRTLVGVAWALDMENRI